MNRGDPPKPVMSIGALSRATGVPASTIRTWERRYGFPTAERGPGGHRQYPAALTLHLVLLKRAIDAGHRPGQVMTLTLPQLQTLLRPTSSPVAVSPASSTVVNRLLRATRLLDEAALQRVLVTEFSRHRATVFLDDHLGPFVVALGDAWARGELQVYHEHFASNLVCRFLAAHCRQATGAQPRGVVVLATLPRHTHIIGLHMAAVVLANGGWATAFLGADTPISDIAKCSVEAGARAVCLSIANGAEQTELRQSLAELRAMLPADVELISGGSGAVAADGVVIMDSLRTLETWALG